LFISLYAQLAECVRLVQFLNISRYNVATSLTKDQISKETSLNSSQIYCRVCQCKNYEYKCLQGGPNFPQSVPVKEFWKSINIWQRYGQKLEAYSIWPTLYIQ